MHSPYSLSNHFFFVLLDAVQQQIVQAPSSSHERNHDPSGGSISRFGSADVAKHRVRAYFQSLRDQLNVQEVAALTVVDTYIRERLCSMRQQEEDCEVILSQVLNAKKSYFYLIYLHFFHVS